MCPIHFIAAFLCAPPAATQFSVVRAPPVHSDPCPFFSFDHIISVGTACGDSVFCSVEDFCASLCVFLSLSGHICASLCFSEALWASLASLGLSGPLWASPGLCCLGLSGYLWASLDNKNKTLHT